MAATTQELFEQFHQDNPHIYRRLVELVEEWLAAGRTRLGIGMLIERLRWDLNITTTTQKTGFKLSNNFKPWYARLLVQNHPEWPEGLFQMNRMFSVES